MSKTIAIDFDGVIHQYSKRWHDGTIYDPPMPGAFATIQMLMDKGYAVFVFSTRSSRQIKHWLDQHLWFYDPFYGDHQDKTYLYDYHAQIIPFWVKFWNKKNVLGITKKKLPAIMYIDDRAYHFKGWEKFVDEKIK